MTGRVEVVGREISLGPFEVVLREIERRCDRSRLGRSDREGTGVGEGVENPVIGKRGIPNPSAILPLIQKNPLRITGLEIDPEFDPVFLGQKRFAWFFARNPSWRSFLFLVPPFPPERLRQVGHRLTQSLGKLVFPGLDQPVTVEDVDPDTTPAQTFAGEGPPSRSSPIGSGPEMVTPVFHSEHCKLKRPSYSASQMNPDLAAQLDQARENGDLLASSHDNIVSLLGSASDERSEASVAELAGAGQWDELNDRFFQQLAFGTGGLRSRTISKIVTAAERGSAAEGDRPEFPCVGTNALNYYNITRATLGLVRYLLKAHAESGAEGRPSIALARDSRHFGGEFAECVTRVATENGVDMFLFPEPRSTPQLSFAVRHLNAGAGIVLTASHNPPSDNGYKVYWSDGAQIVEPHAGGIIAEVNAITGEGYDAVPEAERGTVTELGPEFDEDYMARLESLLLDPDLVQRERDALKIVFTNLHGTGGRLSPAMLRRLGFRCDTVPEQDNENGWFPTVKSPNPENAEALEMAIAQAERDNADIVIATDPDCDRMGVSVRNAAGEMQLITGNQIGSLMAWYRIETLFNQGILNDDNRDHAGLVKTFVTTELQTSIAKKFGIRCVNTLTGFKYIGEKLGKYEAAIPAELRENYRELSDEKTRALRLEHSTFFVFGGEESYGYLGADFLRDKDGNGAVVMFAELAAYAKSQGLTIPELLDRLFCEYGYFLEGQHPETLPGADGAAKIQALAGDYSANPPAEVDGSEVIKINDFATQDIDDEEGDRIPKEKMLFLELADGRALAVRPSGTEPKIKFYFFLRPAPGTDPSIAPDELESVKAEGAARVDSLKQWVIADMQTRLASFD